MRRKRNYSLNRQQLRRLILTEIKSIIRENWESASEPGLSLAVDLQKANLVDSFVVALYEPEGGQGSMGQRSNAGYYILSKDDISVGRSEIQYVDTLAGYGMDKQFAEELAEDLNNVSQERGMGNRSTGAQDSSGANYIVVQYDAPSGQGRMGQVGKGYYVKAT